MYGVYVMCIYVCVCVCVICVETDSFRIYYDGAGANVGTAIVDITFSEETFWKKYGIEIAIVLTVLSLCLCIVCGYAMIKFKKHIQPNISDFDYKSVDESKKLKNTYKKKSERQTKQQQKKKIKKTKKKNREEEKSESRQSRRKRSLATIERFLFELLQCHHHVLLSITFLL